MAIGMSCALSARLVAVTIISSSCCAAAAGARPTVSAAMIAASGFGEYRRACGAFKLPVNRVIISILSLISDDLFFLIVAIQLYPRISR